jgi:cytoplasmic iron level regulating protein YaaA (DUF328/UPF0246 family)
LKLCHILIHLFLYELSPAKSVALINVICYSILEVIKMISILSPAKTLDMSEVHNIKQYSEPLFIKEAAVLMDELKRYSPAELETLMKINSELAETNFTRNISWKKEHFPANSKQAIFTYAGTVYQGLNAATLDEGSLLFAQNHLRILSGLYGVLRPLDLIQPYRLEMGIKLKNPSGNDLYAYWMEKITSSFIDELNAKEENTLINLASNEYFSVLDREKLKARIVTPVFKDYNNGSYKIVMVYAKRARGLMARFIAENKIDKPDHLMEFDEEGYLFNKKMSSENEYIFHKKAF